MRSKIFRCRVLFEARMVLELRLHSFPSKSVTRPPASRTIKAIPAKSHGVELLSTKASQAPEARYPMSEPATRIKARHRGSKRLAKAAQCSKWDSVFP